MPTLNWIGKEAVTNHHNDVPFRTLDKKYTFNSIGNEKVEIRNEEGGGDQISNSSFEISNSDKISYDYPQSSPLPYLR